MFAVNLDVHYSTQLAKISGVIFCGRHLTGGSVAGEERWRGKLDTEEVLGDIQMMSWSYK